VLTRKTATQVVDPVTGGEKLDDIRTSFGKRACGLALRSDAC
jgi:hypothetical protein